MKTYTIGSIAYQCLNNCPKCEGVNKVHVTDRIATDISEAETTCTECGHSDYWAYGFYEGLDHET